MSLQRLGELVTGADDTLRWRFVAEFLQEYRCEPQPERLGLLTQEPGATGDEHRDVLLAALGEFLAERDA